MNYEKKQEIYLNEVLPAELEDESIPVGILGKTPTAILEYILKNPDGAEEPDIREYLRETLQISALRNIKYQLEKMSHWGLIKKEMRKGKANRWMIEDTDPVVVCKYVADLMSKDFLYGTQLFHSPGMNGFLQKFKEIDWVCLRMIALLGTMGIKTLWKSDGTPLHWITPNANQKYDGMDEVSTITLMSSPSFFFSVFGEKPKIMSNVFWLQFNIENYRSIHDDKKLKFLHWHWIICCILFDICSKSIIQSSANDVISLMNGEEKNWFTPMLEKMNVESEISDIFHNINRYFDFHPGTDPIPIRKRS